ncbi:MAG: spermidine/putrescine ABC transporter substrate-binding protein [Verrucomicrobia bacterium]|jgi:spermidine/putrescine transport system substrate-binding protein|nr:spermidine/putrescine ABC transporter substrate-binding protein [Verrucomicrobiota bacterium]
MRFLTVRLLPLVLCLGVLATREVCAAEPRLNLFIWSEYIDPAVVAEFERRFTCKVVIDLYEDDGAMMAKLQAGGAALYDVVVPPDFRVPALIKLNLLAPLRRENLPNLKHLDPKFLRPAYDPEDRYTVPYQWGTVGLFVRRRADRPLPDSWAAVFDPAQSWGPFVLLDAQRDLIGVALKYRQRSVNSADPAQLRDARDLLVAAKRRSVGFDGTVGGKNKVLAKLAAAAIVYSGEGVRGVAEDAETAYVIPREGSVIWVDRLAVLAEAPHRDLAEKFVNFCLEPEIGARISNFTQFASPNLAARPFLKPDDLKNPAIYPPPEVLERLEMLEHLGSTARLYDEVWTQVKAR